MKGFYFILISILILPYSISNAIGKGGLNLQYANSTLQNIATGLPFDIKGYTVDNISNNNHSVVGSYKGNPIVAWYKDGVIEHLGVDIFGYEIKDNKNQLLFNFIERYLLELLIENNKRIRAQKIHNDGVVLTGDLNRLPLFGRGLNLNISIELNEGRYHVECGDEKQQFSLSFPATYGLISGKNKIELEDRIQYEIINSLYHRSQPLVDVNKSKLKKISDDIYEQNRGYYILEQMSSSLYFKQVKDTFAFVCSEEYPLESIYNLLSTSSIDRNYTVRVKQQKYSFKTVEFYCSLRQMIAFYLQNGCVPYIGIEEIDDESITATLIMVNTDYGYNHMLKFEVERKLLAKSKGVLNATLNCYIPMHSLENIHYDGSKGGSNNKKIKIKL